MKIQTVIYSLTDEKGIPFYVGKTCKPLDQRLNQHLYEARRYMNGKLRNKRSMNEKKILKIIDIDFKVQYNILEIVTDIIIIGENPKNAVLAEYIWITKLITDGHNILNIKGQKAGSQKVELEIIKLKRSALEIRNKIKQLQKTKILAPEKATA